MTPERYKHIGRLFDAALALSPEQRAEFLFNACGDDAQLRLEVDRLLASHLEAETFLSRPAMNLAASMLAENNQRLQATLPPGHKISHYEINSLLGVGGMGQVYLATDTRLGRQISLKLLPAGIHPDSNRLRRFENEARTLSSLSHHNILTIYDIGEVDSQPFFTAEYVDGATLRDRMVPGGAAVEDVLPIALQLASGLSAAHEAGIVHRDIKPENLMVRRDGVVKILDFGLTKLTERILENGADTPSSGGGAKKEASITDPGMVIGTTAYMSPEQVRGLKLDSRTDVFSLGVVLYEMLTGVQPFSGDTPSDTLAAILTIKERPLTDLRPDVPPELARIIAKAMRKDRNERYQYSRNFLQDLRNLQDDFEFQSKVGRSPVVRPNGLSSIAGFFQRHRVAALMVLLAVCAGIAVRYGSPYIFRYIDGGTNKASINGALKRTRLTTNGHVTEAAISPDGQLLAYVAKQNEGWVFNLRQINGSGLVKVMPSSTRAYKEVSFSPDGTNIYFLIPVGDSGFNNLFQIPTLGGKPRKLISDVDSAAAFSPDGSQIAFRREVSDKGESNVLIANADGTGERVLATRKLPEKFWCAPTWSPDGKTVATFVEAPDNRTHPFFLVSIDISNGTQSSIGSQRWTWGRKVAWLPDGSGLVVNAWARSGEPFQIYRMDYPSGQISELTNDYFNYQSLSLSRDTSSILTIQEIRNENLYEAPIGEIANARQLSFYEGISFEGIGWTPDNRIIYGLSSGGAREIWATTPDGSSQQQLTNNGRLNYHPVSSPDGKYVVFVSDRAGTYNIWRMNADGSNQVRLTTGGSELDPTITPDSKWVVFETAAGGDTSARIWRIPITGGDIERLSNQTSFYPAVSPDGKLIAFEAILVPRRIAIIPSTGGDPISTFPILSEAVKWSADSKSLLYVDNANGFSTLTTMPIATGKPKALFSFKNEKMFDFALSRDGKRVAFVSGTITSDVVLISKPKGGEVAREK